jgi:predicted RNase H-like nuclease (RuvC/YqgF family)
MSEDTERLERRIKQLEEDNRELFQEVMTGINDTARLAKENLDLKSRDSVRAYERLGGENLTLLERVRELETSLFEANEEIDELKTELRFATDQGI